MTLQEFLDRWNGKYNNYDNAFGPQCKDLFSQYNKDVAGNPSYIYGDAWKLYDAPPTQYYDKIVNTPTSVPEPGDIIVWKQSFGGYGHVAIFINGDVKKMRVFGQNYPITTKLDKNNKVISNGSPCQIVEMGYSKVTGYLRPKSLHPVVLPTPPPPPVPPTPVPVPVPEPIPPPVIEPPSPPPIPVPTPSPIPTPSQLWIVTLIKWLLKLLERKNK